MVDRMVMAGFRFDNDDFELSFWMDLGLVHEWQEYRRQARLQEMMFGGIREQDVGE